MGDRLVTNTIDTGRKDAGCCAHFGGWLGSHLTQWGVGPGLPLYQVASWSIQPFGRNRHGPKIGGCAPMGRVGSPSNTMWPELRSTPVPSFVLIHLLAWPQYTNVADRQDRQDNGPIAYGEPFYKQSPKNTIMWWKVRANIFETPVSLSVLKAKRTSRCLGIRL